MNRPSPQHIRRDILRLLKNNGKKAYRAKELANNLGYKDQQTYQLFRDVLGEMAEKETIGKIKGGRYVFKPRPSAVEGVLQVNPRGFGFVTVEGMPEDVFVRARNLGTALDGDRVQIGLAAPRRGDKRREGEILGVVQRKRTQAVGTFRRQGRFALVRPDDRRLRHDIYVAKDDFGGAQNGDKVIASIDTFDDPLGAPEGVILSVLGRADDPGVQVLALAMSFDVRSGFPKPVIEAAENIDTTLPQAEIDRRLDLREERIFTIDPEDAKDFDDAIHIKKLDNGNFEVGVHIADVSYYVPEGSALDEEAVARATSVYLVDRVIPMLPEKLSNKVCSLRPHEDKFTFSCIMEVSSAGSVKGYKIEETVIRSQHRFTYADAQALIEHPDTDHAFAKDVRLAKQLAERLTRKRMREGSVDFDLPEVKVILDDAGHPINIVLKERKESNRLVEEFMLMANRTISRHIGKGRKPKPFVYRIHDHPDAERLQQLAQYVRAFGYRLEVQDGKVESRNLNALLNRVKGAPEEAVIEEAALRAMAKAKYSTGNIGHYGLGFQYYSHFTSPIRRYPDLIAHRLLKRYAKGGSPPNVEALESVCDHCSERERAAVQAERESVKLKKVEYIREHLGKTFDGVVSGVTKFGVFVELSEMLVEGMVHVRDMNDDFYEYDDRTYRLMGQDTGKSYRLGDAVKVVVARADVEAREIDFLFAD